MRQVSPGKVERSELMLWVATMGMHLGWRERAKNFSSPVGSFSPTVAKCWYSSQMKKTCRKCCFGIGFDLGDAVHDSPLEVELHHDADGLGQTWIERDREVEGADFAGFDQFVERRQRSSVLAVSVELGVVAFLRWTEGPFDHRVVVEQRQEYGDAFDN